MPRLFRFALAAFAVLAMLAGSHALAQPADADVDDASEPGDAYIAFIDAINEGDFEAVANVLAPPARRLMIIIAIAQTRGNAARERVMERFGATGDLDEAGQSLANLVEGVRNWDEQQSSIDNEVGLLSALATLSAEAGRPLLPPAGEVEFEVVESEERGPYAWITVEVSQNGRAVGRGNLICQRVGDEWKLVTFHQQFAPLMPLAIGMEITSPAAFDVVAARRTRNGLLELEAGVAALDTRPPAGDGETGDLLDALDQAGANVPDGMREGSELVDGWGNALAYEPVEGGPGWRLTSAGYDGEFGNDDDLATRDNPSADVLHPRVRLTTNKGEIVLELNADAAPNSVANFLNLVREGFYDGTKFHRIVDGFMAQGGCPFSRTGRGMPGTGDCGHSLPDEVTPEHRFDAAGILAYANSGPHTSSCQFFITLAETPHLNDTVGRDGVLRHYTIIGHVVEGMDVVREIGRTPVRPARSGERSQPTEDVIVEKAEVTVEGLEDWSVRTLPRRRGR